MLRTARWSGKSCSAEGLFAMQTHIMLSNNTIISMIRCYMCGVAWLRYSHLIVEDRVSNFFSLSSQNIALKSDDLFPPITNDLTVTRTLAVSSIKQCWAPDRSLVQCVENKIIAQLRAFSKFSVLVSFRTGSDVYLKFTVNRRYPGGQWRYRSH